MRFVPKSENEIASENLFAPGIYGFEIMDGEDAISKSSGAEMIKLTLHIFGEDGSYITVFDYLLESMAYKLRHAAEACGLLSEYESGALDAFDFKGKTGRCKIAVQKDKSGQFPDKNGIADYIKSDVVQERSAARPSVRVKAPAGDIDDDIPF